VYAWNLLLLSDTVPKASQIPHYLEFWQRRAAHCNIAMIVILLSVLFSSSPWCTVCALGEIYLQRMRSGHANDIDQKQTKNPPCQKKLVVSYFISEKQEWSDYNRSHTAISATLRPVDTPLQL
jgi:hypothetical protein